MAVTLESAKLTDCLLKNTQLVLWDSGSPWEVGEGRHPTTILHLTKDSELDKTLPPVGQICQKTQVWLYSVQHFCDNREVP